MKKLIALLTCVISVQILNSPQVAVAGSPLQIRDTMRTIERLQDAAVHGDEESMKFVSKLMTQIETDIATSVDEKLSDQKNTRAIIVYLLSGGNPNLIEKSFRNAKVHKSINLLFSGSLAYANGEKEVALSKLSEVSKADLPTNITGRLLLIQAILISEKDPKAALSLLNQASSLMPGTIVDEGSRRRCVAYAAKSHDTERFKVCSSVYIRNFQKSQYWKEFAADFLSYAATFGEEKPPLYSNWLLPTLEDLPTQTQVDMLLSMAKIALLRGNFSIANLCGSRVALTASDGSVERSRALLYSGSAMLGLDQVELGGKRLKQVDTSLLDQQDADLLEKAKNMFVQITADAKTTKSEQVMDLPQVQSGNFQAYEALVVRAQKVLQELSGNKKIAGN